MSRFADADAKIAAEAAPHVQCHLCRLLATLPAHERADLTSLLDSDRSSSHISRVLDQCGITLGDSAIKNHRAKHRV